MRKNWASPNKKRSSGTKNASHSDASRNPKKWPLSRYSWLPIKRATSPAPSSPWMAGVSRQFETGIFFGSGKIAFPDEEKQNHRGIAVLQSDGIISQG